MITNAIAMSCLTVVIVVVMNAVVVNVFHAMHVRNV